MTDPWMRKEFELCMSGFDDIGTVFSLHDVSTLRWNVAKGSDHSTELRAGRITPRSTIPAA